MSTNATKRKGKLIKNERHAITSEYSLDGLFDEFYRVKVAEGRANREVGLIDLDVPFANMASLFRFKPTFTWNDWDPKEGIVRESNRIRENVYLMSGSKKMSSSTRKVEQLTFSKLG